MSHTIDQLAGNHVDDYDVEQYDCGQCGGDVNLVRTDRFDHIEAQYYRCQDKLGCRQGGERVYDRDGELMRTAGPVFDKLY